MWRPSHFRLGSTSTEDATHAGGTWTQDCSSTNAADVTIQAPPSGSANYAAVTANYSGSVTVDTLTIQNPIVASAGQSLYGVFATGSTTTLTLTNVNITVAPGGAGTSGTSGTAGANGSASGCAAGTPGTAGAGGLSGSSGDGGNGGTYSASGYTPSSGVTGTAGGDGYAGAAGQISATCCEYETYSDGGGCPPASPCAASPAGTYSGGVVDPANGLMTCAPGGLAGCPGKAGTAGGAGTGGGSSIGVFMWDATLYLNNSAVRAGNGGSGGNGGNAGASGTGANGLAGPTLHIPNGVSSTCVSNGICGGNCFTECPVTSCTAQGGTGTRGGQGGASGAGGGGSGGDSIALYFGGNAHETTTGGSLSFGSAGAGGAGGAPNGGNARSGNAGATW